MSKLLPLMLLFALAAYSPLHAQSVAGRLLDQESGSAIVNATISLLDSDSVVVRRTTTDPSGVFQLVAPEEGTYRVTADHIAYTLSTSEPLALVEGERLILDLRLSVRAIRLEAVTVVATPERRPGELGGFYDRKRHSVMGTFVTRDQWERFSPNSFTTILSMNGVRLNSRMQPTLSQAPCVKYVLDGFRVPDGMISMSPGGGTAGGINSLVNPDDIQAIEIYKQAAHVPIQYAGGFNQCGAIIIWTNQAR